MGYTAELFQERESVVTEGSGALEQLTTDTQQQQQQLLFGYPVCQFVILCSNSSRLHLLAMMNSMISP